MPQPHLVRVPLDAPVPGAPDGDAAAPSVIVEMDPLGGGVVPVARPGQVVANAAHALGETFDQVRQAAEVALHRLTSLSVQPQRIELEMGVKLGAEAGALIARTAAEGNVVLRLVWERPRATGTQAASTQSAGTQTTGPQAGSAQPAGTNTAPTVDAAATADAAGTAATEPPASGALTSAPVSPPPAPPAPASPPSPSAAP